jgi:hypothetical protein
LIETALDIFGPVTSSIGDLLGDERFDVINVISEVMDSEANIVFDVSVADKADSDFKFWVIFLYVIYDLFESIL